MQGEAYISIGRTGNESYLLLSVRQLSRGKITIRWLRRHNESSTSSYEKYQSYLEGIRETIEKQFRSKRVNSELNFLRNFSGAAGGFIVKLLPVTI